MSYDRTFCTSKDCPYIACRNHLAQIDPAYHWPVSQDELDGTDACAKVGMAEIAKIGQEIGDDEE